MLRKDEKLKNLESSVQWLRNESVNLANNIETLKVQNKNIQDKLKEAQNEVKVWRAQALNTKAYNLVLKETIEQLKSKKLIAKYEQQGAMKAIQVNQMMSELNYDEAFDHVKDLKIEKSDQKISETQTIKNQTVNNETLHQLNADLGEQNKRSTQYMDLKKSMNFVEKIRTNVIKPSSANPALRPAHQLLNRRAGSSNR